MRRHAVPTLTAFVVALSGCGGSDDAVDRGADAPAASTPAATTATPAATTSTPAATARKWTSGYPRSIAVLGHSGATGENSDPDRPHVEIPQNSWATGTNPKVHSVYLRLLERNPAIAKHNFNFAEGGATIDQVSAQADRLLATDARADLILIQVADNDMTCPLDPDALSEFRDKLATMLQKIGREAPDSAQFIVSQFGSPSTFLKTFTRDELASQGGTGPCATTAPNGKIRPQELVRLEKIIHAYEAALRDACDEVRQCTYDGGAFGEIVDRRGDFSSDFSHFSIQGHAKAAAVAWAALRRAGVVPRRG